MQDTLEQTCHLEKFPEKRYRLANTKHINVQDAKKMVEGMCVVDYKPLFARKLVMTEYVPVALYCILE
jgi:hypothetical protein